MSFLNRSAQNAVRPVAAPAPAPVPQTAAPAPAPVPQTVAEEAVDDFNEQDFMDQLFAAEIMARSHGTSIIELLEGLAQTSRRISLKVPTAPKED